MRVALLTRSLTRGGVQVQVVNLARGLTKFGCHTTVVSFYGGQLEEELRSAGIPVHLLGKAGRFDNLKPLLHLRRFAVQEHIDVLYSFLPMENLLGLMAARLSGRPIVWGMRCASVNTGQFGMASRVLYGLQFALLSAPDALVSNSLRALQERGLDVSSRNHVVPNGIDTERFTIQKDLRNVFRRRHELPENCPVIGTVARLDPLKDHVTFLRAAREIVNKLPDARFVVAGDGVPAYRSELQAYAKDLGLGSRVLWLGEVRNPADVYNGMDLLVSSSRGEGFSNAIAEAMSCGVPIVATDVGDSARIVSELGLVVPPQSPQAIAAAAVLLLDRDTVDLRKLRRDRILREFSQEAMVTRTASILETVLSRRRVYEKGQD